ncbi:DUF6011 domain-containing protein [Streptosporangium canum]|uniref:DUF6011 domain-containing protein n=1 Tax=Streptosporangium canum TaxID=324952 RepID=UPI0037B55451
MTLSAEEPPRPRKCRGCPKKLTDPVSIALGFGPECARKRGITPPASTRPARVRAGGDVPGQTLITELTEEP